MDNNPLTHKEQSQMIDQSLQVNPHHQDSHSISDNFDQTMKIQGHNSSTQNISQISQISISAQEIMKKQRKHPLILKKQKYSSIPDLKNFILCDMESYFKDKKAAKNLGQKLNNHSIISSNDEDRLHFSKIFETMKQQNIFDPELLQLSLKQSRGIGAVLGMGIGDALGSCTQFKHFTKVGYGIVVKGFSDLKKRYNRHGKVSVWTDDASMGLCMADCVLLNDYIFNPIHMRYLFVMWLQHGLNNGGREYSIGLGGNISISMYEFMSNQQQYTQSGDRFNNGNGSLMRLAPIPVAYCDDKEKGIQYSGKQSLTTHNGLQAQQCSKLMATIIIELIHRNPQQNGKQCILRVCDNFKTPSRSVQFLAKGHQESEQFYNECCAKNKKYKAFNKTVEDRKWNWRQEDFTQDQQMIELYSQMEDFEYKRYELFLKGYKLINKKMI